MEEIWKDIEGYEGFYKISNLGRVKSLPRNGTVNKERIMVNRVNKTGYWTIHLRRLGVSKYLKIHRLIAIAFIEKVEGKDVINHKDGNKLNNSIDNLEWCTHSENAQHAHDTGLRVTCLKQIAAARKRSNEVNSKRVMQMDVDGKEIQTFKSMADARRSLGKSSSSQICNGCRKQTVVYGYRWKYV